MYQAQLLKADINISAAGDNTVIVGPTENSSCYIAIDHINMVPASAVNVQLKDGGTAYGGAYPLAQNQGFVIENAMENEHGIITLSPNQPLVINLSSAVQVSGFIRYRILGSN